MQVRLLAVSLLVTFLVFAGALFSIPWLIGEPVPVVRPDAATTFSSNGEPVAQFQANAAGDFVLLVRPALADTAPRIAFTKRDHAMSPVEADVEALGGGLFRADGRLPMPGRWQLSIDSGEAVQEFDFVLAEF